jgi:hypothetical protein
MISNLTLKYSQAIEIIQKYQILPIRNAGFSDTTLMSTLVIRTGLFAVDFIDVLRIFKSIDYEEKPKMFAI